MQTQQRYAYKLVRGIIARREGFEQKHVDPETGKTTTLRTRPFVHYQSRTAENPLARDEIMLTEEEAAEYNQHGRRLVRLVGAGVKPKEGEAPVADSLTLEGLMNMLTNARGGPSVKVVRQVIFNSGLLATEKLPHTKAELMAALQLAIEARNKGLGVEPNTGGERKFGGIEITEADRPE